MNKPVILLGGISLFFVLVPACNIETHSGPDMGGTDPACASFCLRLYDCGSLETQSVGNCLDVCEARMSVDAEKTQSGCECVADDACRPVSDYHCPDAPFPRNDGSGGTSASGGTGGTGGTSATGGVGNGGAASGGASSGGTAGTSTTCSSDPDCPAGSDCVNSVCAIRCIASCQCPESLSCVASYCQVVPPPTSCATDCDCPAGDHCVAGACG